VTINIGGQPAQPPGQTSFRLPGLNPGSMPGATGGLQSGPAPAMPASLQQYQPATVDSVHQLWSSELGSGAVQSPYAMASQQIPGPTPMAI
jgi:hypothetical protein